jgi:hypothetical protein
LFFVDLPNQEEREAIWKIQIVKFGRCGAIFASSLNHHFQPAFPSPSLFPEPVAGLLSPNRQTTMKKSSPTSSPMLLNCPG